MTGRVAAGTQPDPVVRDTPCFEHLRRLTFRWGIWEHTREDVPRVSHGSCTDDTARALLVTCQAAGTDHLAATLVDTYLDAVVAARAGRGRYRNRRGADGRWQDERGPDDTHGRVWWALGTVAASAQDPAARARAAELFSEVEVFASPHLRPNATTALGAATLLAHDPGHLDAQRAIVRCADVVAARVGRRAGWPEARLSYDNARIPDALVAAGEVLGDDGLLRLGLDLLDRLVRAETTRGRFSFVPTGGRPLGGAAPAFDQQPVEAAAMATACARAWRASGDTQWRDACGRAVDWLFGANDAGVALHDPATGATYDGLERHGVNRNRGAEAAVSGLEALLAGRSLDVPAGAGQGAP